MSRITGIIQKTGSRIAEKLQKDMMHSVHEILPFYQPESECCITADARIDYREELIGKLELRKGKSHDMPDSQLILRAYLKWGTDCVKYLYGDFAFVIWDERSQKLFCARDHFGCRPFYYAHTGEYFVFSSDIRTLLSMSLKNFVINEQYILDSLVKIVPDKTESGFEDLFRLAPAHSLTLEKGEIHIEKYWELNNCPEISRLGEEEAATGLREQFNEAVTQRCRSLTQVGLELSGGIDSSSVACVASTYLTAQNRNTEAFSQALSEEQKSSCYPFLDEYAFSDMVVRACGIKKHHLITGEHNPGGFMAIKRYLELKQRPSGQGYAMFSDLLYTKVQQEGIKVLLSGFAGDEGVTSQGAGYFEELSKDRKYKQLQNELKKRVQVQGGSYLRLLTGIYTKAKIPWLYHFWVQLHPSRDFRKKRFLSFPVEQSLVKKYSLRKRYFERVGFPTEPDVLSRQRKRIMHNHLSERLENSYLMAQERKIEYRYPFLDVKLIEFYYSLPSEYKYKNGYGRYIFRQAMKGILPEEVRLRKDKSGTTVPNVYFRLLKDEKGFREIIDEGKNNNRFHYVDYEKLHQMLNLFIEQNKGAKLSFGPGSFITAISVLLLQKWQREGKIDIGIKC